MRKDFTKSYSRYNILMNNLRTLLISAISILLFFLVSTFPFEVPDEQSHYATVHYLVDKGRIPTAKDKLNRSQEEGFVERLLGSMSERENRYSHHPEYRVEQVSGIYGKYEDLIKEWNTPTNRSTYTHNQAAIYPPLYYYFSAFFYRLVEDMDFLHRLFLSRIPSTIFTLFLPIVAYLIGRKVWQTPSYARLLAYVTLMFPMTTYLSGGVNSDTLHNLLFGLGILLSLMIIKSGLSAKLAILLGVVFALDLITKPQAYLLLPIYLLALVIEFRFDKWLSYLRYIPHFLVPCLLIAGWWELPRLFTHIDIIPSGTSYRGWDHFRDFLAIYFHTHLAEMPVWYWGVFKWFGVILPRFIWWPAIRLFALAIIGTLIHLYRDIKAKKLGVTSRAILFSYGSNLIYIAAIFWFDWQFYQEYGRSLGLQARYYYPLLLTQLFIFVQGLLEFGWNKRVKEYIKVGIIFFFLSLHFVGLYTQLSSYYDLWPIQTFINQISQYKPFFAKGYWWLLWTPMYIIGIITLTIWTLKHHNSKLKTEK